MTSLPDSGRPYLAERVRVALATDERAGVLGLVVRFASERIFISGAVPSDAWSGGSCARRQGNRRGRRGRQRDHRHRRARARRRA